MEKYVIYLRKSRADIEAEAHGEGETLSRHKKTLQSLAKRLGLEIGETYQEIVSGETIAARPMMTKLLREVGEGKWNGVLVMEVERLARGDTMDQGLVAQTFKYSGTKIITPLKIYDPENEFDEEYFEFGLFMSRREYITTNRRLQRGRAASAREGKFVGSKAPYGYKRKKLDNEKGFTLEIVPEEAEIVRLIFDLYINDGKRLGMKSIAHKLNELKIPPIRHDYWQKETIHSIITNPVYAGIIRWGYRKVKKTVSLQGKKISRPISSEEDCVISKGLHAAIISKEQFDKAQTILKKQPAVSVNRKNEIKNPLCGLIICKKCGRKMVFRRGYKNKPDYIKCPSRECPTVSAPFCKVEERLFEILREWLGDYEAAPENISDNEARKVEQYETIGKTYSRELAELEKQRLGVYDLTERGIYSDEVFKSRMGNITQKIEEIKCSIAKLEEYKRRKTPSAAIPKANKILEIYETLPSPAYKNELLKEIIAAAVYDKEKSGALKNCAADDFRLTVFPILPNWETSTCVF